MDLQNLKILKEKVLTAEDIEEPWQYFFTEFGGDPEFHQRSERADPTFLRDLIEDIGEKIFKQPVMVMQFHLSEIPGYDFLHGVCVFEGRVMSVIYFRDADTGLFSLMMNGPGGQVLFGRFTLLGHDAEGRPNFFTGPSSRQSH
ncbi:MAG TPA: hypothetical protein VNQ79_02050 [Blastocatellia bacterium]|nr:hypothetical protein [Blastocatellia bacterium]